MSNWAQNALILLITLVASAVLGVVSYWLKLPPFYAHCIH